MAINVVVTATSKLLDLLGYCSFRFRCMALKCTQKSCYKCRSSFVVVVTSVLLFKLSKAVYNVGLCGY